MTEAVKRKERPYRFYGDYQDHMVLVPKPVPVSRRVFVLREGTPSLLADNAYRALHIGFVAVPLIAGIDKFAYELVNWPTYLAPIFHQPLGLSPQVFMYLIGAWEIFLGVGMVMRPRFFADLLSVWLVAIIGNLLIQGEYFDIALFNFGLASGACALARLSKAKELERPGDTSETEDSKVTRGFTLNRR